MRQLVTRPQPALKAQRLREAPGSCRLLLRFAREMAALAALDRDADHRDEAYCQLLEGVARDCGRALALAEGRARDAAR